MSERPTHAPMDQFPVVDDCLLVGGVPLPLLARRVGQTPFYAYDRRLLSARVRLLRALLPGEVSLHYAVKANPMPAVVQHVARTVDGLDVADSVKDELRALTPEGYTGVAAVDSRHQIIVAAQAHGTGNASPPSRRCSATCGPTND